MINKYDNNFSCFFLRWSTWSGFSLFLKNHIFCDRKSYLYLWFYYYECQLRQYHALKYYEMELTAVTFFNTFPQKRGNQENI